MRQRGIDHSLPPMSPCSEYMDYKELKKIIRTRRSIKTAQGISDAEAKYLYILDREVNKVLNDWPCRDNDQTVASRECLPIAATSESQEMLTQKAVFISQTNRFFEKRLDLYSTRLNQLLTKADADQTFEAINSSTVCTLDMSLPTTHSSPAPIISCHNLSPQHGSVGQIAQCDSVNSRRLSARIRSSPRSSSSRGTSPR
jgi:hypothetical protein